MRFGKCSLLSIVTAGLFVGTSAHAATHVVEKFGTDNGECSKKKPCLTIQSALFVAAPNAKIIVGPGIYEEFLHIDKDGQKLESTGGMHTTRINATGDPGTPAIAVSANNVSIGKKRGKGFEIVALNAFGVQAGEYLVDSCEYDDINDWWFATGHELSVSNFRLEGNSITTLVDSDDAPVPYGIWCDEDELITLDILPGVYVHGSGAKIASNTITSQGTNGVIMANPQSKYLFQDNVVRHQPYSDWSDPTHDEWNYGGFLQWGNWGATGTIKGNNLANTGSRYGRGIFVDWSDKTIKIQGNAIKGFEGGVGGTSFMISVDKNIITDVYGVGVFSWELKSIKDNVIQGVSSLADWSGIHHYPDRETSKVDIKGNNISNFEQEGIYISEGAGNRIYHNHLNNRKNAYDGESNIWDNGYPAGGNYWSDYPGPDIYMGVGQDEPGNDSIGDTPYIIDGNSRDNYPFIWIYIPPISISNVTVSPTTASIGTPIKVCADVSAISGVKNGGVIAKFTRDGSVVKEIRLHDHNKDGRYCHYRYFTEPGIYHVDVIAADRDGRVMALEDAATFVILD